jgi:hypothetical protein
VVAHVALAVVALPSCTNQHPANLPWRSLWDYHHFPSLHSHSHSFSLSPHQPHTRNEVVVGGVCVWDTRKKRRKCGSGLLVTWWVGVGVQQRITLPTTFSTQL